MTSAEAEALDQYRKVRERGRLGPRVVNGPRISAKAAQGWKGARFDAFFLGAGILVSALGIVFLAAASAVKALWDAWPVGMVAYGLWLLGLGPVIMVGHPIKVLVARRGWRSWVSEADAGTATVEGAPSTENGHEDQP